MGRSSVVAAGAIALLSALPPAGCQQTQSTRVLIFVQRADTTAPIFSLKGATLPSSGVEPDEVTLTPITVTGLVDAGPPVDPLPFPLQLTIEVDANQAGVHLFAIAGYAEDGTTQVAAGSSRVNVVAHGTATSNPVTLTPGTCGDGILNPGERCDDGNGLTSTRCSPTCDPLKHDATTARD